MSKEAPVGGETGTLDVGGWLMTLVRNWWVILILVVLGAVAGGVATLVSPTEYTATSAVYIGQTTDANGNSMAGLNSNARAATQLLASDAVLSEAAEVVGDGVTASSLARNTTVEVPTSIARTNTSAVNIVTIAVTDENKERAAEASNALATILVEKLSESVDEKIAVLEEELASGKKALAESMARSRAAQEALDALGRKSGEVDKAAAAPYLAIVQASASEQQAYASANQKTELLLLTARQVEQPRILHDAKEPSAPSGPNLALNVAAGALAGLVVGILLAFVRQRVSRRG